MPKDNMIDELIKEVTPDIQKVMKETEEMFGKGQDTRDLIQRAMERRIFGREIPRE